MRRVGCIVLLLIGSAAVLVFIVATLLYEAWRQR